MSVDVSVCEWSRVVAELIGQLREPFEATDTTILMTEGHWKHAWHNDFHTSKIPCSMLWRGLVNYNNINAELEIVINQMREIIVQVQTRWSAIKVAKSLLEGLLLL